MNHKWRNRISKRCHFVRYRYKRLFTHACCIDVIETMLLCK